MYIRIYVLQFKNFIHAYIYVLHLCFTLLINCSSIIYVYIYIYSIHYTYKFSSTFFLWVGLFFVTKKRKIYLNFTNCIFGTASCITFTVTMCTNTSKFTISNNLVFITNWGTSHMIFQNFTNTRCITCLCR